MSDPILVGLALRDDDDAPIALARELARFTGAPLALVNVYPYEPGPRFPSPEFEHALRNDARHRLERVAETLRGEFEVAVHVCGRDSVVRGLHDTALALDASQLVIGSTHRGPLLRVMPGGTGERLLHAAPCALAIAPRGYAGGTRRIRRIGVAFVDTPEGHDALDAAAVMAALGDAELTLHTILEPAHDPADRARSGSVTPPPPNEAPRIEQAQLALRARIPAGIDAELVVDVGEPCDRLAAASEHLDLLVCGSRGYGPVRTVLLGSVSSRLAHTAACPLLVLPRARDRASAGQSAA